MAVGNGGLGIFFICGAVDDSGTAQKNNKRIHVSESSFLGRLIKRNCFSNGIEGIIAAVYAASVEVIR
jgi:hypothetical protein